MFLQYLPWVAFWVACAFAAPTASPSVKLDNGTFYGTTSGDVQKFYGIPFAQPPVGNLRFNLPQALPSYTGTYTVTSYGPSCPQQSIKLPILTGLAQEAVDFLLGTIYAQIFPDAEDCLTLNIVKPAGATSTSKLPVLVWIFGGGFELGSTSMYDGAGIVERSIDLGKPVIYVSMNYRLAGFGFLPGKEVKAAGVGNLGLFDQRAALEWIQKYITQFGGDPTKVTIWGESAGAISASLHMVSNGGDTKGLFRAAFMESGAPIPVGDISNGQKYYDFLVSKTGCSSASDTLACLRTVPYATLKSAINQTPGIFAYQSLNLAWLPRVDGVFLTDQPLKLVQQGKVANIPYVTGNNDDEGTLFALSTLNVTTTAQLKTWVQTIFDPAMPASTIDTLLNEYPADITQGSPFGTSVLNALTPQFKRIAAFQGDAVFQGPRRWLLENTVAKNTNVWSYLSTRFKALPVLGSVHGSDILNVYGGGDMADYLIRFAATLNPNGNGYQWPKYNLQSRQLLEFSDGLITLSTTTDTYRQEAMAAIIQATLANPI